MQRLRRNAARLALHLHRAVVVLTVLAAAAAPALDLGADVIRPDHALAAPHAGQDVPGADHDQDCGSVSVCSALAIDPPDSWQLLALHHGRATVEQDHQSDLWHPGPGVPVPIVAA